MQMAATLEGIYALVWTVSRQGRDGRSPCVCWAGVSSFPSLCTAPLARNEYWEFSHNTCQGLGACFRPVPQRTALWAVQIMPLGPKYKGRQPAARCIALESVDSQEHPHTAVHVASLTIGGLSWVVREACTSQPGRHDARDGWTFRRGGKPTVREARPSSAMRSKICTSVHMENRKPTEGA